MFDSKAHILSIVLARCDWCCPHFINKEQDMYKKKSVEQDYIFNMINTYDPIVIPFPWATAPLSFLFINTPKVLGFVNQRAGQSQSRSFLGSHLHPTPISEAFWELCGKVQGGDLELKPWPSANMCAFEKSTSLNMSIRKLVPWDD